MIDNFIHTESFPSPEVDRREVLRYAGVRECDGATDDLLTKCIAEVEDKLTYKVCYRVLDLSVDGDALDLGFALTKSKKLAKRLDGCEKIVIFCATVGSEIDRFIAKYNYLSPSGAVCFRLLAARG